jgi:FixJ family two-component response regulator
VILGRKRIDSRDLLDALAAGHKPRQIASQMDCAYSTVRKIITRCVHAQGFQTPEQAVAQHVAEKIKKSLPLALQNQVDLVMRKKT